MTGASPPRGGPTGIGDTLACTLRVTGLERATPEPDGERVVDLDPRWRISPSTFRAKVHFGLIALTMRQA